MTQPPKAIVWLLPSARAAETGLVTDSNTSSPSLLLLLLLLTRRSAMVSKSCQAESCLCSFVNEEEEEDEEGIGEEVYDIVKQLRWWKRQSNGGGQRYLRRAISSLRLFPLSPSTDRKGQIGPRNRCGPGVRGSGREDEIHCLTLSRHTEKAPDLRWGARGETPNRKSAIGSASQYTDAEEMFGRLNFWR